MTLFSQKLFYSLVSNVLIFLPYKAIEIITVLNTVP